jgi:hypothetical protein
MPQCRTSVPFSARSARLGFLLLVAATGCASERDQGMQTIDAAQGGDHLTDLSTATDITGPDLPRSDAALSDGAADAHTASSGQDAGTVEVAGDAAPADDARLEPDSDSSNRDDGGSPPSACLPDGTGRLAFKSSGGFVADYEQGNDGFCAGEGSDTDSLVLLNWVVPVSGTDLKASVSVSIAGLSRGQSGAGKAATFGALLAGDKGNIWMHSNCLAQITADVPLGSVSGSGALYKLVGTVECPGSIMGATPNGLPLMLHRLEFSTGVLWP